MSTIVAGTHWAGSLHQTRRTRSNPTRIAAILCMLLAAATPMCGHAATLTTFVATQVTEGGPDATVAVQLAFDVGENPASCQVSGALATQPGSAVAGSDYQTIDTPFSLTLTPADASVQQQITIPIVNDAVAEPDEAFDTAINAVDLTACPLGVTIVKNTTVAIADDDAGNATITFSASVLTVNESAGTADIQVTLNGAASLQAPFVANVDVTTVDGTANSSTDFTATTNRLVFDAAQLTQTVTVQLIDDFVPEATESFSIVLSNGSALLSDQRTIVVAIPVPTLAVTITDDDVPGTLQFSTGALGAAENGGSATVTVNRVGGTLGAVSITYAAVAGTATAGTDFTPVGGTLNWPSGDGTAKSFLLPLIDDSFSDPNETITLTLTNPTGGATGGADAIVTILDDESPLDAGGDIGVTTTAGATVSSTFFVTGTPPIALAARLGTLTPTVLDAPGNATYTYTIPANTPAGTTLNDTVTATDSSGNVANKQFTLQVAAPAARNLTDIPTLTPNQLALATWFDDFCPRLAATGANTPDQQDLLGVCANLRDPATTNNQVVGALDAINPEPLLSAASTTLRLSSQQHGNLEQRINALRSGASGIDLAGLNLNIDGQQVSGNALQSLLDTLTGGGASADDFGRWGVFVNGRINFGEKDQTQNQTGFDFDTIGITSGVDYRMRDNFVIGAAIGYSQIDADFDQSVGHLDIETWNLSLFGTYFSDDKYYVDAALNYGDNSYDSVRHIVYTDVGGTVDRTAVSDSSGMETSIGLASGYDFGHGAWTFGPHVGSYYYDVDVNEFRETGAGGLNMIVDDQNAQSFTLNGGGHVSYVITPAWGVLVPHLRVDYVHEFEGSRELIGIQVAADPFNADPLNPTPTIILQTDKPDPDYVVWSAGFSAQFINGMSGFVNYQSTEGYSDLTLTELTFGLRWERSF